MVKILWLFNCWLLYANRIPDAWKESVNFGFIGKDLLYLGSK